VFLAGECASMSARTRSRDGPARRSTRKAFATRSRAIVRDGIVEGYFLGSYSARKLGIEKPPGTPAATTTLSFSPTAPTCAGMLKKLHRGLLVTELMGQGVNLVTGDYSRGAAGYWVEGGEIRFPVEEVTSPAT